MSDDLARIEQQLRLAIEGPAWHGPSVLETLADVSAADAHAHPIAGAHSIWELVLHLAATYELVLRRLAGDSRQLSPAEDWATVSEPTEQGWQSAIQRLREVNYAARAAVVDFPADALDRPLVAVPPYTAWVQFIGLTQHDLYHAGQIVLLKRALGAT